MSQEPAIARSAGLPRERRAILRGEWRRIAQVVWLAIALLSLVPFTAGIPLFFAELQSVCPETCSDASLTRAQVNHLLSEGLSVRSYAAFRVGLRLVSTLVWTLIGLVIFWRKSDDRMAWFTALSLVTGGPTVGPEPLNALVAAYPSWSLPVELVQQLTFAFLSIFFCTFPDGQFVPRWTRWAALLYPLLFTAGVIFRGSPVDIYTWPLLLNWLALALHFGLLVFAQVYRYRHTSSMRQRQQTKWVVFGTSMAFVCLVLAILVGEVIVPSLFQPGSRSFLLFLSGLTLALLLIPVSIAIAVLRYNLYDIDVIINRTLVYGALTSTIVGLYILVVGRLGALFQAQGNTLIALIATGLVALIFQPLRMWLQRGVNRLLYGERDEPYAVLARLGRRLESAIAPDAVLPTIVQTVRESLKLPFAAIALKSENQLPPPAQQERRMEATFEVVAESGAIPAGISPEQMVVLPLSYQGETIGQLRLAPRSTGESFSSADRRLLDDLVRQAGAAVHAVRLTADLRHLAAALQRSTVELQQGRERLVLAREEERRRLRRDLHDDLAPTLAGLAFTAGTAHDLMSTDPSTAADLLGELHSALRGSVGDIRRLVYELRPPALDDFGLVAAVRERAAQFSDGRDTGVAVSVEAPEHLPPLPAAVEVAAYRIVQEAMMNVVRHAQARQCQIRIALHDGLHVEVLDDGAGLPEDYRPGVGLRSMRERAAELGGWCDILRREPHGTRVTAFLPLPEEKNDGNVTPADR